MTTETLFKPGNYKTRDGRDARVYATDGEKTYPIHGAIFLCDEWALRTWTAEGKFKSDNDIYKGCDLMLPKREVWVTLYSVDGGYAHYDKEQALKNQGPACIARVRVEFTEGQFDE